MFRSSATDLEPSSGLIISLEHIVRRLLPAVPKLLKIGAEGGIRTHAGLLHNGLGHEPVLPN